MWRLDWFCCIRIRSNYLKPIRWKWTIREKKATSPKDKKWPSLILFGNHLALFLARFLPVNHLVTTKNWVKIGLVTSNFIKPYKKENPEKRSFSGFWVSLNQFKTPINACWTAERDGQPWGRTSIVWAMIFLDIPGFFEPRPLGCPIP